MSLFSSPLPFNGLSDGYVRPSFPHLYSTNQTSSYYVPDYYPQAAQLPEETTTMIIVAVICFVVALIFTIILTIFAPMLSAVAFTLLQIGMGAFFGASLGFSLRAIVSSGVCNDY